MKSILKCFYLLFILLFSISSCSESDLKVTEKSLPEASFDAVVLSNPADTSQIVGWIGNYSVTSNELRSFSSRHLKTAHSDPHGGGGGGTNFFDPVKSFTAYVPFRLLVQEAEKRGLKDEINIQAWKEFKTIAAMAPAYRRYLEANAIIDPKSLAGAIPSKMIRMNFAIKTFADME